MGMLIDFLVLKKVLEQAISGIDHVFLNQVPPFDKVNPSAENVAKYLFEIVEAGLPNDADAPVTVAHVKVWETDLASAVYRK
jgi:6-pyruvoyltetrahydropterin/6-carboxytetrahydropterin synthase